MSGSISSSSAFRAALKRVVKFACDYSWSYYLSDDCMPIYQRFISFVQCIILSGKLSDLHLPLKEFVHILFYSYWVGKSLFSRCTYKIFVLLGSALA